MQTNQVKVSGDAVVALDVVGSLLDRQSVDRQRVFGQDATTTAVTDHLRLTGTHLGRHCERAGHSADRKSQTGQLFPYVASHCRYPPVEPGRQGTSQQPTVVFTYVIIIQFRPKVKAMSKVYYHQAALSDNARSTVTTTSSA